MIVMSKQCMVNEMTMTRNIEQIVKQVPKGGENNTKPSPNT